MAMIDVDIDTNSGFCNGVVSAINKAEKYLSEYGSLYCLGDIVHNSTEVTRLESKGLKTICAEDFSELHNCNVLLRAHGEPPSTYAIAKDNGINIIDATCPVVLALQRKIRKAYENRKDKNTQIVIFGKQGHAEVNGLVGQTNGEAIVIEHIDDISKIDFGKEVLLFSQTTQSIDEFRRIVTEISQRINKGINFEYNDTICRQVVGRIPKIINFVSKYDLVFFVCGRKSSNGRVLYEQCKKVNSKTRLISDISEIDCDEVKNAKSIGICGATSTPLWQMAEAKQKIMEILG